MNPKMMNRFQNESYGPPPHGGYGNGNGSSVAPLPSVAERSFQDGNMPAAAGSGGGDHYHQHTVPIKKRYRKRAAPPCGGGDNNNDDDAPLVTPTVNSKMSISKAFMLKNMPTPPLANPDLGGGGNGSETASKFSPTSVVPHNPLDLLSLVSTHVAKNEEERNGGGAVVVDSMTREQRQDQMRQQHQDNVWPELPVALPGRQQRWQEGAVAAQHSNNHHHHQARPQARQVGQQQDALPPYGPQPPQQSRSSSINSNYVGERNPAGQRHGRGRMRYPNGCTYSGTFRNNKRHGYGECRYPNGCTYAGFWSNGQRSGVGKMAYADRGDVYEGEWRRDERHGRGIYHREDGRADVCRYERHEAVGEGTQWSPNREYVVRLVDGVNVGRVSIGRALEICDGVGVPGVPRRVFMEFASR